jgi:hypothetical protein
VVGGQSYSVLGYTRTAVTGRASTIAVDWYTTAGAVASVASSTSSATTSTTTYATRTVTNVTAPADAAFARIRVKNAATAAGAEIHYWDSIEFEPGSNTTFTGWAAAATYYWRAAFQDVSGLWSDYSVAALVTRTAKGTLTITIPSSGTPVVQDATPPVAWTFTGTQKAFQITVKDAAGLTLNKPVKVTSALLAATVPAGVVTKDGTTYTLTVEVWDTVDREATPGDAVSVVATRSFTYTQSATVTVVAALTATDLSPVAAVQLAWTRASAPDSYTILRDSQVIASGLLPGDLLVSGTTYAWVDYTAAPRTSHTWEVRAVVNNVTSTANPTVTKTIFPTGIWLMDPTDGTTVQLLGQDDGDWDMGEQAENFVVVGSDRVVRITAGLQGYEGNVTGIIAAFGGKTLAQIETDLFTLKGRIAGTVRLAIADLNFPVVLGNVVPMPTPSPDLNRKVKVAFWQQGENRFTGVL